MDNILEIIIITLAGIGAAAFIVWYFFFAGRDRSCGNCTSCRDEIKKSIRDINSSEGNRAKR